MKKFGILFMILSVSFLLFGCPPDPPPVDETPTVVEEVPPEPEPEPKVEVVPEPEPEPVKASDFKTVYFDFDKSNLIASAKAALESNAAILHERTNVIVKLEGHCDERGTEGYNLSLGQDRANSAKEFLVELGINSGRIETKSLGKLQPAVQGSNEEAWAKNRRVEFKVVSQ